MLAGLLLAAAGCDPPPAARERFRVAIRAAQGDGTPVSGVRVWADGRELGATSAEGMLDAEITAVRGARVRLTAACPPAFRTRAPERELVLAGQRSDAGPDLQLTQACEPLTHRVAIVVLARGAKGAALPVRIQGRPAGQTDPDGTAHLLTTTRPGAAVRVSLDTSAQPDLRPSDPVHTFHVAGDDAILLVDQTFTRAPRRPRPSPARRSPRARPQRIE